MSDNNKGVQTSVKTVEADLEMFNLATLGGGAGLNEGNQGGQNGGDKKPNFFSQPRADMKLFDQHTSGKGDETGDDQGDEGGQGDQGNQGVADDDQGDQGDQGGQGAGADAGGGTNLQNLSQDDDQGGNAGRPRTEKNGLLELTKKLIEAKQLVPFDDDKPIDKYSVQDFEELYQANFEDQRTQMQETVSQQFWESLPEEVQHIGHYLANGGKDLKGLLGALAQVEHVRDLNIEDEVDQELIVRDYYRHMKFGTDDEITDEIKSLKDLNKLADKAKQFKPKLDKVKEDRVTFQLQQQEEVRRKQQEAAKQYMQNVYSALEPGVISGIKLDNKTKGMLYAGLVQTNYPSIFGKQTNMLGHLLEQHQFVKPNHALIAEALWLLKDPDGYREQIRKVGAAAATNKAVRMLKTEESRKTTNTADVDEGGDNQGGQRKLSRPVNVFTGKRT